LAALYWELVLIRWLGTSIRIVAYFSNLVLISAFFGLGAGALLTRLSARMERLIAPLAAIAVWLGVWLGDLRQANPESTDDFIWVGAPLGVASAAGYAGRIVSSGVVLVLVYVATALVLAAFGQYMGRLFKTHPPLRAYSMEVAGSVTGISLFALLSYGQTTPTVWFACGFCLLLLTLPRRLVDDVLVVLLGAVVVVVTLPDSRDYVWSPYYRISVDPLTRVEDRATGSFVEFGRPVGHVLTVNNDFHQMMLDLRPRQDEHPFLAAWRAFYDAPYRAREALPPGPILVVGAGTGNDVSAALRNTGRHVTAVEIDPAIAAIGARLHFEHPYDSPRVSLVIDDARSFFHRTKQEYALVVFGFLDSHRLLSSFSSVRLDNFIYTRESMSAVKELLVPGGRVALSFASNRPWIHMRMVGLLDDVFDLETTVETDTRGYVNGTLYSNGTRLAGPAGPAKARPPRQTITPTDDWPFLYLRTRTIPGHNLLFLVMAVLLSASAFLIVPRGERRIRLPYLFLGAAFFLLETSNVVRMSLLYGSTWWVNTVVFTGILLLVLLSNLTAAYWRVPVPVCAALVGAGILLAASVPTSTLLSLDSWVRALAAVALFLGPVYFGGLIFARLITHEARLFEAYGSNVLGAVLGGVSEYLSLLFGFRFLLAVALAFYLAVFLLLRRRGAAPA
jgi:SAM-dependent methyltransferase